MGLQILLNPWLSVDLDSSVRYSCKKWPMVKHFGKLKSRYISCIQLYTFHKVLSIFCIYSTVKLPVPFPPFFHPYVCCGPEKWLVISLTWCCLVRYGMCFVLWEYWAADRRGNWYLSDRWTLWSVGVGVADLLAALLWFLNCCFALISEPVPWGEGVGRIIFPLAVHNYCAICVTEGVGGIFGVMWDSSVLESEQSLIQFLSLGLIHD